MSDESLTAAAVEQPDEWPSSDDGLGDEARNELVAQLGGWNERHDAEESATLTAAGDVDDIGESPPATAL